MSRRNYDDLSSAMEYSGRRDKNENSFRVGVIDLKKLPENVKMYKLKENRNTIDIIPYEITSEVNPILFDKKANLKKGSMSYLVRFSVHKNIGVNKDTVICPKNTYGKPCPICEERSKLWDENRTEEAKALNNSERALYWIKDIKGETNDLQVLEQSTYYFEKELLGAARAQGDDIPIPFANPNRGKSVVFLGEEQELGKNKFLAPKSFSFKDRQEQPGDTLVDKTFDLSDCLILLTYEELNNLFYGIEPESNECKEENLDDEKPKEETKPKQQSNDCPEGHVFGKDFDKTKECDSCPGKTWDLCNKAANRG